MNSSMMLGSSTDLAYLGTDGLPGSDSAQLQREVLCDQMIIMEHNDNVDFKL